MPILNLLISFFSLICILLCIFLNQSEKYIFILPITVFLVNLIFIDNYIKLKYSLVFNLFVIQSVFRFLVAPILFLFNKDYFFGLDSKYINIAIFVMAIEFFILNLVFYLFKDRQNYFLRKNINNYYFKNNYLVLIALTLMFLYVVLSGATEKIVAVWQISDYVEKYVNQAEELEYNTFGILVFHLFKVTLILLIFGLINNSLFIKHTYKKWLYALTIILSSVFMVGLSRFNIVFNLVVAFTLLKFIIDSQDMKKVFMVCLPCVFFIFIFATISKFSRYGSGYSTNDILDFLSVNAYFSGFINLAIGFDVYNTINYKHSLIYFINDTLQNIPILSKFTYDDYKTNLKFNEFIYGHKLYSDQIVPLSIGGLFHFGYIGLVIYSPIFISLALYFERLSYCVYFIGYKYILIYFSAIFSLVYMFNLSSFYAGFFRNLIFLMIPILIIYKISSLNFSKNR